MDIGGLVAKNIVYRAASLLTGLLVTVLFTRLLGAEGYGLLSLLIANVTLFSLVTCLGSESGITFHYASRSLGRPRIFFVIYSVILFQLVLLLVVELIHHRLTGYYWLTGPRGPGLLIWGLLYLFAVTLSDKYMAFLNAAHRFVLAAKIILYCNIATLLTAGAFYFFDRDHTLLFYLRLFISAALLQAIVLCVGFYTSTRQSPYAQPAVKNDWKLFFSYSFLVFFTNVIQFLAYRVDYWLVDYYHGERMLGLYSLAVKLGQMFWFIPLLLASMIFPMSADKQSGFNEEKLGSLVRIANTMTIGIIIIAGLLAQWVIPLTFGDEFTESVRPFLILLPGLFLFSINIMLAAYFAGRNRLLINFAGSVICFVLVLVLDLILIPRYGIEGAAWASSIAYASSGIFSIIMLYRAFGIPPREMYIMKSGDWSLFKNRYLKFIKR
jgi:O-antigen/teichoic acid export membrane protein